MRHGTKNFKNVLAFFFGTPWAIHPQKLAELRAVIARRVTGAPTGNVQDEHLAALEGSSLFSSSFPRGPLPVPVLETKPAASSSGEPLQTDAGYTLVGSSAVIGIGGTITPRPSLFDELSGGTSHESIGRITGAALADGKVESIVYDIDSPGGTVFGMPETADLVKAAGKQKPTFAVANHIAASAAYWYASQATEVYVTPGGQVGCIGVLLNRVDETEALKQEGVSDVLISNASSPFKTEGYPQTVFTADERADMQKQADAYGQMFVDAVANGRGIRPATVARDFGRGRMLMAADALEVRMVDGIKTLQDVVDGANKTRTRAAQRKVAADLAALKLKTG